MATLRDGMSLKRRREDDDEPSDEPISGSDEKPAKKKRAMGSRPSETARSDGKRGRVARPGARGGRGRSRATRGASATDASLPSAAAAAAAVGGESAGDAKRGGKHDEQGAIWRDWRAQRGARTFVWHIGSEKVRFGSAVDPEPHEDDCVVAYRRACGAVPREPPPPAPAADLASLRDELVAMRREHWERAGGFISLSARPPCARSIRTLARHDDDFVYTDTSGAPAAVFGAPALRLPADEYEVYYPMRGGRLAASPTGSVVRAADALGDLVRELSRRALGLGDADALASAQAVLVIADGLPRRHVLALVDVFLGTVGYGHVLLVQEPVAAAFAVGTPICALVDVGATKCSIACVEEARIVRKARAHLPYGMNALDRVLAAQLAAVRALPDRMLGHLSAMRTGPAPADPVAARELQELREVSACFFPDEREPIIADINERAPGAPTRVHEVTLGDAPTLAALALFHPQCFGPLPPLPVVDADGFSADPFDDRMARVGRSHAPSRPRARANARLPFAPAAAVVAPSPPTPATLPEELPCVAAPPLVQPAEPQCEPTVVSEPLAAVDMSTASVVHNPAAGVPVLQDSLASPAVAGDIDEHGDDEIAPPSLAVPLDEAVFAALARIGRVETRRRAFATIVLVGGGALTPGLAFELRRRVHERVLARADLAAEVTAVDVLLSPRELSPKVICWKGGAVTAALPTAQRAVISAAEWRARPVQALQDKMLFPW